MEAMLSEKMGARKEDFSCTEIQMTRAFCKTLKKLPFLEFCKRLLFDRINIFPQNTRYDCNHTSSKMSCLWKFYFWMYNFSKKWFFLFFWVINSWVNGIEIHWIGGGTNNPPRWDNPSNWNPAQIPGVLEPDTVTFNTNVPSIISLNNNTFFLKNLSISAPPFTIDGLTFSFLVFQNSQLFRPLMFGNLPPSAITFIGPAGGNDDYVFNTKLSFESDFTISSEQASKAVHCTIDSIGQSTHTLFFTTKTSDKMTLSFDGLTQNIISWLGSGTLAMKTPLVPPSSSFKLQLQGGTFEGPSTDEELLFLIEFKGNANIVVASSSQLTLSGDLSGKAGFTKKGENKKLVLTSSNNTYQGTTTIASGALELKDDATLGNNSPLNMNPGTTFILNSNAMTKTIGNLSGSGTIQMGTNSLQIPSGAFSGKIMGSGGITKIGSGHLKITGSNEYTGITQIQGGVLAVQASGNLSPASIYLNGGTLQTIPNHLIIANDISINNNSAIDVQGSSLKLTGQINGSSPLTKSGTGQLIFPEKMIPYNGVLTISGGEISLGSKSILPGPVVVANGGKLSGTGQVSTLTNNGLVSPGSSLGTLTINGDYNQESGTLFIEFSSGIGLTDLLSITGKANLNNNGILEFSASSGIYPSDFSVTIITAEEGIVGRFGQKVDDHPFVDFVTTYLNNSVLIEVGTEGLVLPVPIKNLKGNAAQVANALFSSSGLPSNEDALNVLETLVALSPDEFVNTLPKLSPAQMRALPLAVVRNDTQIANLIYDRYNVCRCEKGDYFWVSPLGSYYKQEGVNSEIGFRSRSAGVSVGQVWFWHHINFGLHTDYLHSKLCWQQNAGTAHLNAVYLGPFAGYITNQWYVNAALLGARTFYHVDRHLHFGEIHRTAHNHHKSWNGLVRIEGGTKIETVSLQKNFFIAPRAILNYLNIWESTYREDGADTLDLVVQSKHSAFLNPRVDVKFIKEIPYPKGCFSTILRVGWQSFIPLSNGYYNQVSFRNQELSKSSFSVEGLTMSTHQLILGGNLDLIYCDNFSMRLDYEANLGDRAWVHQGNISLFWQW